MLSTRCPPRGQAFVGSLGQKKAGQKTRYRWKGAEDIRRLVEFRVHHDPLRIIDSEDARPRSRMHRGTGRGCGTFLHGIRFVVAWAIVTAGFKWATYRARNIDAE